MSPLRTPQGEAATQLILAIFRTNGLLLAAGDLLSADEGLTSARWQVLGAVALAQQPLTVPQIARRMGLTRQSVHVTVGRLVDDGLLRLEPNADHRRSHLVLATDSGAAAFARMQQRQARWIDRLAADLNAGELQTAARVVSELGRRLEQDARDRRVSQSTKEEDDGYDG